MMRSTESYMINLLPILQDLNFMMLISVISMDFIYQMQIFGWIWWK